MELSQFTNGIAKLTATSGFIHKIGTDTYVKSLIMLPSDTLDMYEEVDEKPKYTEEEYKRKVSELIHEKYDADSETSLINNMLEVNPTEEHKAEYEEYQAYRAECKRKAREFLSSIEQ